MCLCVYVFMQFMGQGATFTDYVQIRICEIAANAENRRQIGGYIIAPKSHLTAKTEGRAKAEGRSGVT